MTDHLRACSSIHSDIKPLGWLSTHLRAVGVKRNSSRLVAFSSYFVEPEGRPGLGRFSMIFTPTSAFTLHCPTFGCLASSIALMKGRGVFEDNLTIYFQPLARLHIIPISTIFAVISAVKFNRSILQVCEIFKVSHFLTLSYCL